MKCQRLEAELDLRMKVEIHEIEERKNEHINELMQNHEQAFTEMKQYQNDITRENIELIKQLKEKLTEYKKMTLVHESNHKVLEEEIKELTKPLAIAQQEASNLQKSTCTMDKDTIALRNARGFLKDIKTKTTGLKDNRDLLDKQFKKMTQEKKDM